MVQSFSTSSEVSTKRIEFVEGGLKLLPPAPKRTIQLHNIQQLLTLQLRQSQKAVRFPQRLHQQLLLGPLFSRFVIALKFHTLRKNADNIDNLRIEYDIFLPERVIYCQTSDRRTPCQKGPVDDIS